MDRWDRKTGFCCATCAYYAPKKERGVKAAVTEKESNEELWGDEKKPEDLRDDVLGRCRRNAPTMVGYPVVYADSDWCGEHKIGTNPSKIRYSCDQ